MSRQTTFAVSSASTSSAALPAGSSRSGSRAGRKIEKSGPAVAPASRSRQQGSEKATKTNGTSGQYGSGSSASVALSASLASKLKVRLGTGGLMEYRQTWKEKATPSGRVYWAHTASAHRPCDSDCSGWPTAAARDWRDSRSNQHGKNARPLNEVAMLAGFPTPTVNDHLRHPAMDNTAKNVTLNHAAILAGWSSPRTPNGGRSVGTLRANGKPRSNLETEILGATSSSLPAATESSGACQLNPAMSRWLMGFPAGPGTHGWDSSSPNWSSWVTVQNLLDAFWRRPAPTAPDACAATATRSCPK